MISDKRPDHRLSYPMIQGILVWVCNAFCLFIGLFGPPVQVEHNQREVACPTAFYTEISSQVTHSEKNEKDVSLTGVLMNGRYYKFQITGSPS